MGGTGQEVSSSAGPARGRWDGLGMLPTSTSTPRTIESNHLRTSFALSCLLATASPA